MKIIILKFLIYELLAFVSGDIIIVMKSAPDGGGNGHPIQLLQFMHDSVVLFMALGVGQFTAAFVVMIIWMLACCFEPTHPRL